MVNINDILVPRKSKEQAQTMTSIPLPQGLVEEFRKVYPNTNLSGTIRAFLETSIKESTGKSKSK